ncbi:MAG: tRNA lysidine(34) synthetase TilS [Thermodesulfobacteriota bacterium]
MAQALGRAAAGPAARGILVACSGGLDSVCLLHLLAQRLAGSGTRLEVAHVDHGLREGSARDAGFCRRLADDLGLAFHHLRLEPGAFGRGRGLQAEGRRLRRRFLEETLASRGLGAVALGHHADDQVETVLFRLLRGAGPRGLAGMQEWAPPYLRPLLGVRRAGLEDLARRQGWAHREDPSNQTDRFARNRLRRAALPALRAVHPGADAAVLRLARSSREDDACLSQLAREALGAAAVCEPEGLRFPRGALAGVHPAVRRRVYLAAWEAVGCDPEVLEARHLESVEALLAPGRAHRRAPLPGPGAVASSYGELWFLRPGAYGPAPRELGLDAPEAGVGLCPAADSPSWTRRRPPGVPAVAVPGDRGGGGLWARTRRPGDRLELGPEAGSKVKDLLMDARLPRWRRAGALVVGDAQGVLGLLAPGWAWGGEDGGGGWVWLPGAPASQNARRSRILRENRCCPANRCDT